MSDYLADLRASLTRALDFADVVPLHGAPGNPWCLPVISGVVRPDGRVHSEIELLCLMWALVIMLKPKLVIETGTDAGVMTRALGAAVRANGFGRVLSAEIDERLVAHARQFCDGLPVEIHHGPALDLPIEQADLLFIDSSYESRVMELKRIKAGAVAVVHDTCRKPAIGAAVREWSRYIQVDTPRGFAVVQR